MDNFASELLEDAIFELRKAAEDFSHPEAVECVATAYKNAEPYIPDPALIDQLMAESDRWFTKIPYRVEWVYDGQPFNTMGQMRRHCLETGVLLMYAPDSILGPVYARHRAVHDYFGHILPNLSFGVIPELAAFRLHKKMYSPELHPLLFADVVLNNAFYEANGTFYPTEKYTLISDEVFTHCPYNRVKR